MIFFDISVPFSFHFFLKKTSMFLRVNLNTSIPDKSASIVPIAKTIVCTEKTTSAAPQYYLQHCCLQTQSDNNGNNDSTFYLT